MGIALIQAGAGTTVTTGTGTVSVTGCVAGNFILLHVMQAGPANDYSLGTFVNVEALDGTDLTMTIYGNDADVGSPRAAAHSNYFGRVLANGTVSINVTVGGSGEDVYARLYEFSGVHTGPSFTDVAESGSEAGGTAAQIDDNSVTSTGISRLGIQLVAVNDDNVLGSFTGETGGDWAEAAEYNSATGTQATLQLQTAEMSAAGTINGGTFTMAASDAWGVIAFALIPAPTGGVARPNRSSFPKAKLRPAVPVRY